MNDRLSMVRRYRVRMQAIVAEREEMALKRARSDGLITTLLAELALSLPEDERVLVQEIVVLQNQLWSVSPSAFAKMVTSTPETSSDQARVLMEWYTARRDQSPKDSAAWSAYHDVASCLALTMNVKGAALEILKTLIHLSQHVGRSSHHEERAIYREFLTRYAGWSVDY